MPAKARVLIATSSRARAKLLAGICKILPRPVDVFVADEEPESYAPYRLVICDPGPALPSAQRIFGQAREDAHLVLLTPSPTVAQIAQWMQDPRVCHFIDRAQVSTDLPPLLDKLETGAIFGLDRHLPPAADVCYRQVTSYEERCDILDQISSYTRRVKLGGHVRRNAAQVAEELLMNAMYQAPVSNDGKRLFGDVPPKRRIKRQTPRRVSVRYCGTDGAFYVSVRDRYGSLKRDDLARCFLRCTTEQVQIEDKALGAGLGLYLIASSASHLIVNLMPERLTEVIVILKPEAAEAHALHCLSVTTQLSLAECLGLI